MGKIAKISLMIVVCGAVLLLGLFLSGSYILDRITRGKCERLELIARQPNIQEKLKNWVDKNVGDLKSKPYTTRLMGGRDPGLHLVKLDFDWRSLDVEPNDGQIRLVLAGLADDPSSLENVRSVSFSEVSRASILVRVSDSKGFGIDNPALLTITSPDVAVYCAW